MKLWITRTSKESCMLTTKRPVVAKIDGTERQKVFVAYGDSIGAKNLCMVGVLAVCPGLRLEVLESKQVEITVQEVPQE